MARSHFGNLLCKSTLCPCIHCWPVPTLQTHAPRLLSLCLPSASCLCLSPTVPTAAPFCLSISLLSCHCLLICLHHTLCGVAYLSCLSVPVCCLVHVSVCSVLPQWPQSLLLSTVSCPLPSALSLNVVNKVCPACRSLFSKESLVGLALVMACLANRHSWFSLL